MIDAAEICHGAVFLMLLEAGYRIRKRPRFYGLIQSRERCCVHRIRRELPPLLVASTVRDPWQVRRTLYLACVATTKMPHPPWAFHPEIELTSRFPDISQYEPT